MSIVTIPKANMPIDQAGNLPSVAMYRWMHDITQRVGGPAGSGINDLEIAQFEDAGIEEAKALLYAVTDHFNSAPPNTSPPAAEELETQVSALNAQLQAALQRIEALEQGVNL